MDMEHDSFSSARFLDSYEELGHFATSCFDIKLVLRSSSLSSDTDDAADGAGTVEYRSGARKSKKSDHRSRIKALRLELQKKGWKSVGYR